MDVSIFNINSGLSTIIPASFNPKTTTYDGGIIYDFKYILYNQIHSIENFYSFGNISNETSLNVEIWNAQEYTDVTIDDISYSNLSGIELINRDTTNINIPHQIKKLESSLFTIKAGLDGDSSNNGNIVLQINDKIVNIGVSISRSFLFDFDIDSIRNIKEYYVYNTRIIPSLNNTEQRFTRIDIPRVRLEYFYSLSDKSKRSMDAILYANNTNFSVPVYTQTKIIDNIIDDIVTVDILNTSIQAGMDVLIKDIYSKEVIKVLEVIDMNNIRLVSSLGNIYSNPILIPCISGKLAAVNNKLQKTKNFAQYTLTFEKNIDNVNLIKTNNEIEFNKYNGLYILEEQNSGEDIQYTFDKNIILKDNGFSKTETTIYNNVATVSYNFNNYAIDKDEISKIKNLFNNQKGMFNDLYSRSFTNNIKVVENIAAGDIIIIVENNNLSTFYKNNKIKQIYFKYNDNKEKILSIIDISKVDNDKEAIILSNGFGENINKENMISSDFVYLGRLDDDVLTIDYNTYKFANYNLAFNKNNDVE